MRIRWLSSLTFLLCALTTTVQAYDRIRVEAVYDDSLQVVSAHMSTILSNLSPKSDTLHLRLLVNARCGENDSTTCGFVIDSLLVNGADRMAAATIDATDLRLPLPYESLTDKEVALDIYYAVHLPKLDLRFGYRGDRVLLEGWIPVPAPRDDTGWLKIDYSNELTEPVGDYFAFDVTFTAPAKYTIVAPNLEPQSADDSMQTVRLTLDHAGHTAIALVDGFEHRDTTILIDDRECTLSTYFRPDYASLIDSVQVWTAYALQYMSEVVGEAYPHDQYITVLGALGGGGGLEQPQMTWISGVDTNQLMRYLKVVTIHEAIHQWFYYLIPSNQAIHPWMDESVTDYFTARAMRATGDESNSDLIAALGLRVGFHDVHRMLARTTFPRHGILRTAHEYALQDYFAVIYSKGGEIIATLTNLMGERGDVFWAEYYVQYRLRRPTDSAFIRLAEQYVPSNEPGRVAQLLGVMAMPDYSVETVETDDSDSVRTSTVHLLIKNPIPFPLDLRVTYENGQVLDTQLVPEPGLLELVREDSSFVAMVELDPEHTIAIDADYTNNSWSRDRVNSSDYRIFSVLTFLIESAYSIAWGW